MATKTVMPKTLGATIDLIWTLEQEIKEAEAAIKPLKEKQKALEEYLMSNFERQGIDGSKGKLGAASIRRSTVAEVVDWIPFYEYMRKNKAYDLMQKRISVTACRERWDSGKEIPGVAQKQIETLSITTVK